MFEQEQQNTGKEVDRMLGRLETRISAGKIDETRAKRNVKDTVEGIVEAKKILDNNFDFNKATPKEVADLTNAWIAWQETGVLKGGSNGPLREKLQRLLDERGSASSQKAKSFCRQVWRTEMVAYVLEKISAADRADKSEVAEAAMGSQIVSDKQDEPHEALASAVNIDSALKSSAKRNELAKLMEGPEAANRTGGLADIAKLFDGAAPDKLNVVVGGEFLEISFELARVFVFKNMVKDGERIYAQMKNGCRGNLVIIDLGEPGKTPVIPGPEPIPNPPPPGPGPNPPDPDVPPPPVEPPPVNPPPVDPPPPVNPPYKGPPGETPPFGGVPDAERGMHELITVKSASLLPPGDQYHELIDTDVFSHELVRDYSQFGKIIFLKSLNRVPSDKMAEVLEKVFKKLGEKDPKAVFKLMSDILDGTNAALASVLSDGYREAINNTKDPEVKKLLEVQLMLMECDASKDPFIYREVFRKLNSIDVNALPPELKQMYETNKNNLTFILRRSTGTDIMEASISTMDSTFSDPDELREFAQKTDTEIAKGLEGGLWSIDKDAEVYTSSWHVMQAMNMAIKYQYTFDYERGHVVQNPVQYYYNRIKEGQLSKIEISPDDAAMLSSSEPLKRRGFISGNVLDLNKLFIDRKNEFRLFDRYQSGELLMGQETWVNSYRGSSSAFLGSQKGFGAETGGLFKWEGGPGGIVKDSERIFKSTFFSESGKDLGQSEYVYFQKVVKLWEGGSYDEARRMCFKFLEKHLNKIQPLVQPDVEKKVKSYSEKEWERARAQLRENFKSQGIIASTDFSKMEKPDGTGSYGNYEEFIKFNAEAVMEEKAILDLENEIGQKLYKQDAELKGATKFEQGLFKVFSAINGYMGRTGYLSAETTSNTNDLAKMAAEIGAVTATLGFGEALVAGAAGVDAVAVSATAGAARTNLSALRALGSSGMFNRAGYSLGTSIGRSGVGRFLGLAKLQRPVAALAAGSSFGTRLAGRALYAGGFVEGQKLLNGSLHPFEGQNGFKRGLLEIGTVAVTIYGLDKWQQFMRGGLVTSRIAAEQAAGAQIIGVSRLALAPGIRHMGQFSSWVGRGLGQFRDGGAGFGAALGRGSINTLEYATEVAALNNVIAPLETEMSILSGVITEDQAKAAMETSVLRGLANTGAVVLMLRTGRLGKKTEVPPSRGRLELTEGWGPNRYVRDVARRMRKNAESEIPEEIPIGSKRYIAEDVLKEGEIRKLYNEALKMPQDTPEQRVARRNRIKELDHMIADRAILAEGGMLEYPERKMAEVARDSLKKDYPDLNFVVSEAMVPDGKGGDLLHYTVRAYTKRGRPAKLNINLREVGRKDSSAEDGRDKKGGDKDRGETDKGGRDKGKGDDGKGGGKEKDDGKGGGDKDNGKKGGKDAGPKLWPEALPELRVEAHDVDIAANNISRNRYLSGKGLPRGEADMGGRMEPMEKLLEQKSGDKTIREHYEDALKMEPGKTRDDRLTKIDRYAAERGFLIQGKAVEYKMQKEATEALRGVSKDMPEKDFVVYENAGRFNLVEVTGESVDLIAVLKGKTVEYASKSHMNDAQSFLERESGKKFITETTADGRYLMRAEKASA